MSDPELDRFFAAFEADDDVAIEATWSQRLEDEYLIVRRGEHKGPVKAQHMQRLARATDRRRARERIAKAIKAGDDLAIMKHHDRYLALFDGLAPDQATFDEEAVTAARRRAALAHAVREALGRQAPDDEEVATAYEPALDPQRNRFLPVEYVAIDAACARVSAYERFRAAVKEDDDQAVVDADVLPLRDATMVTESDLERIRQARDRMARLDRFRTTAWSDDDQEVVGGYHASLDGRLPPELRDRLAAARSRLEMQTRVRSAIEDEDDEAIADAYDPTLVYARPPFESHEVARIELALRRMEALSTFRKAAADDDDGAVVAAASDLAGSPLLTRADYTRFELAVSRISALEALARALAGDDDEEIRRAGDHPALRHGSRVTEPARKRVELANARLDALARLREALAADDDERIRDAGKDPVLRNDPRVTSSDRKRVERAVERLDALGRLVAAVAGTDERQTYAIGTSAILIGYPGVTAEQRRRIERAGERLKALRRIEATLDTADEHQVVKVYERHEAILRGWSEFARHRPACERARSVVKGLVDLETALAADDDGVIVRTFNATEELLHGRPELDEATLARLELAEDRLRALERFLRAIDTDDHVEILRAYDRRLDGRKEVPAAAARRLARARRWSAMPEAVAAAIRADDDRAILAAYDADLCEPSRLEEGAVSRLELATKRVDAHDRLVRAFADGDDEAVLAANVHILRDAPIVTADDRKKLARAAQRLLAADDAEPSHMQAWIDGTDLVAQWKPPASRFAPAVLVTWRTDREPGSPDDGQGRERIFGPMGHLRTPVGSANEVHVRAFGMMPDPETFSLGEEPTAACTARRRCHVICALTPERPVLTVRSEEGLPLPDMVVAIRHDRPPLSPADSLHHVELDGSRAATTVDLRRLKTRGRTYVRIFTTRDADRGWAHISHAAVDVLPGQWVHVGSPAELDHRR